MKKAMSSLLLLQLLQLLIAPRVSAGDSYIKLYHTYSSDDMIELETGPAQHCYSLSCFDNLAGLRFGGKLQSVSWVVLYEEEGCRGNYVKARGLKGGKFMDDHGNETYTLSSLMLWESSMYPTRGIVDYCPEERAPELVASASMISNSKIN